MNDNGFPEAERFGQERFPGAEEVNKPYPGIDLAAAMKRMSGNRDLLERLLGEFYRNYRGGGAAFFSETDRVLIRNGNAAAALQWLHTLKGVAGNLSARDLYNASIQLERAIREGELGAIDGLMSRWESALDEVLRTAATCHARRQATQPNAADLDRQPEKTPGLHHLMERLASHLDKNSLKSEDVLNHLKTRVTDRPESAPDVSAELQDLSEQLADFAFRDARETLKRMAGKVNRDNRDDAEESAGPPTSRPS